MGYGTNNASGLDLWSWGRLMGFNPWHLAQLADPSSTGGLRLASDCNTLVYERAAVNAQRVGRVEIRQAIETAEQRIRQYRGIWPSPRFIEAEYQYPQLANRNVARLYDIGSDGRWLSITLDDGDLQAIGPAIETGAATESVTYSDEDGDGYSETATISATVPSGTLAHEIVIRFLAADCGPVRPRPHIPPRSVSISGTTATITLDSWTLARPVLTAAWAIYSGTSGMLNATVLPPAAGSPYAAEVEVLRLRADPTGTTEATAAALLIYESRPCPFAWGWGWGENAGSDPSATRTVIARAGLRDARAGIVSIGGAVYNADAGVWSGGCCDFRCSPPDRVILRYQAGTALNGLAMAEPWATTVARLAAATLTADICACKTAHRELAEWQFDLSRTAGTSDAYAPPADLTNPLGSRRGHIDAWRQIVRSQRLRALIAG